MNILRRPCSKRNFHAGRGGYQVEAVVIHLIDGSQAGCDATFANPNLVMPRSAHYSVSRGGEVHQYVDEADTAYHAGRILEPSWSGLKQASGGSLVNPNLYTIGIEHEGRPADAWTDEMYSATAELIRGMLARHPQLNPFTRDRMVLHREIYAGKICPGFQFDPQRLLAEVSAQACA